MDMDLAAEGDRRNGLTEGGDDAQAMVKYVLLKFVNWVGFGWVLGQEEFIYREEEWGLGYPGLEVG